MRSRPGPGVGSEAGSERRRQHKKSDCGEFAVQEEKMAFYRLRDRWRRRTGERKGKGRDKKRRTKGEIGNWSAIFPFRGGGKIWASVGPSAIAPEGVALTDWRVGGKGGARNCDAVMKQGERPGAGPLPLAAYRQFRLFRSC